MNIKQAQKAIKELQREFEDAIVFKVALMVKKYLNASPAKY